MAAGDGDQRRRRLARRRARASAGSGGGTDSPVAAPPGPARGPPGGVPGVPAPRRARARPREAPPCRDAQGGREDRPRSPPPRTTRPQVEDGDAVGDVADHRQVVGDEEVGRVGLGLAARRGGSGRSPGPRRRAPRWARRTRRDRARRRTRARSRLAGARRPLIWPGKRSRWRSPRPTASQQPRGAAPGGLAGPPGRTAPGAARPRRGSSGAGSA